jgi:hypothetical protein
VHARSSVNGWAEKNLSYHGKEALLKSVIQANELFLTLQRIMEKKTHLLREDFGEVEIWIRDPCIG